MAQTVNMFTMPWKSDLGQQIRRARKAAKMSQEALSAEITAKFGNPYSHAQISHIENGTSAPAVNIVTAIAEILGVEFELGGCKIGRRTEESFGQLTLMPQQLSFPFDVEHRFSSATLKLTALPENSVSLQAVFLHGQQKPLQTIEAVEIKKVSA
jgi:transcriptional regulator with XRE-family HTH domain